MNKNPGKSLFWRLCGPLLIYWTVQLIAQFGTTFVLMITDAKGIAEIVDGFQKSGSNNFNDLMMQMTVFFTGLIMKYEVQIQAGIALCTVPVTGFLFLRDRKREQELNLPVNKKAPLWKYGWILVLGAAVNIGASSLMTMTQFALKDTAFRQTSETFYSAAFPVQILCLGIIVPLAEELMFRGILFKRFREIGGFGRAALCAALFFSFMQHGNTVQLVYGIALGILLAYVYEKFGSFKAPLFLHITANLVSIIGMKAGLFQWLYTSPKRLGMAVVAGAFTGAVAFVMIQRIEEKPEEELLHKC